MCSHESDAVATSSRTSWHEQGGRESKVEIAREWESEKDVIVEVLQFYLHWFACRGFGG